VLGGVAPIPWRAPKAEELTWASYSDATETVFCEAIRRSYVQSSDCQELTAIRTPRQAEQILEQGKADIIGLCRALLCDPDWPIKARDGREKEIVRCTGCNWCLQADSRYEKVTCSRWPEGSMVAPAPFLPSMAAPSELPDDATL
jgi:2,4-dienoyl-CoA reductase-like NADH-dependent reductase (Old Yellow Enzyme family)